MGWIGLTSTESVLEKVQAESLADLRQVMTLAERSASLAAKATTIADVRTPEALTAARRDLESRLPEFMALAVSLKSTKDPISPTRVPSIVRLADYRRNLNDLGAALMEAEVLVHALPSPERAGKATEAARRALSAARAGMIALDIPTINAARVEFVRAAAAYQSLAQASGLPLVGRMDAALAALQDLFSPKT